MITRAARFGVLKTLMKGRSSGTSNGMAYFDRKRTEAPPSRLRAVVGFAPGSTALKCSRGVSRVNAISFWVSWMKRAFICQSVIPRTYASSYQSLLRVFFGEH